MVWRNPYLSRCEDTRVQRREGAGPQLKMGVGHLVKRIP